MNRRLAHIAVLVKDYDEAIRFYTEKLGFDLIEDTRLSPSKRWVLVDPGGSECKILLAKAANEAQEASIGKQSGGRVFLFLYTDDLDRDYDLLLRNGVEIVRPPTTESWGRVLVFADLYGNLWDLIEKK